MVDKDKLVWKYDSDGKNAAEHRPETKSSQEPVTVTEKPAESSDKPKEDSGSKK